MPRCWFSRSRKQRDTACFAMWARCCFWARDTIVNYRKKKTTVAKVQFSLLENCWIFFCSISIHEGGTVNFMCWLGVGFKKNWKTA